MAGSDTGELHPDTEHSASALLKAIYFHINWFSNTGVLLDTAFPHHLVSPLAFLRATSLCLDVKSFQGHLGNQDSLGFKV